jgi:hypothetical protein
VKAQGKLSFGRRQFFRVLGAGTAAGTVGPLAAVATETVETAKKRRARYQANSPEVQTFYRVNRYPAK